MSPTPAVYDCTIFAQALISKKGPGGACLVAAQDGRVRLYVSEYVMSEIRALPPKLPARLGVTQHRVDRLVRDLGKYAEVVEIIPSVFTYDRDPDDAHYVDLSLATGANLIVSRDNDLLDLMADGNAGRSCGTSTRPSGS